MHHQRPARQRPFLPGRSRHLRADGGVPASGAAGPDARPLTTAAVLALMTPLRRRPWNTPPRHWRRRMLRPRRHRVTRAWEEWGRRTPADSAAPPDADLPWPPPP